MISHMNYLTLTLLYCVRVLWKCLPKKTRVGMRDSFFMVGLFSCLDALMDASMADALQSMPLSAEAKSALTDKAGVMGQALACVLAIECGDVGHIAFLDLNAGEISSLYMQAMTWATATSANMH